MRSLANLADPALGSLHGSHLDSRKGLIQFLCHRPHLFHAAGEADLPAVIHNLADR